MIIAVLENEKMADLIDRQAAISDFEWCKSQAIDKDRWQEAIDRINALPSADVHDWIPCENRMPEIKFKFSSCNGFHEENGKLQAIDLYSAYESDSVLIVGECKEYSNPMSGIYTAKYYKWVYEDGEECTHWADNIMGELIFENVVAWMPLPKPYEGSKQ